MDGGAGLAVFDPAEKIFCVQKISPTKSLKTRPSSAHVALPYRPVASLMFGAEWLRCWGNKGSCCCRGAVVKSPLTRRWTFMDLAPSRRRSHTLEISFTKSRHLF